MSDPRPGSSSLHSATLPVLVLQGSSRRSDARRQCCTASMESGQAPLPFSPPASALTTLCQALHPRIFGKETLSAALLPELPGIKFLFEAAPAVFAVLTDGSVRHGVK